MSDTVWKAMVEVQQARRTQSDGPVQVTVQVKAQPAPRRRKRPTTLRSVRNLVVPDHYALLAAGNY